MTHHHRITQSILRLSRVAVLLMGLALLSAGCVPGLRQSNATQPGEVQSDVARDTTPEVAEGDLQTLVAGNNAFAWEIYQQLRAEEEGNLFYSPYSISQALAMTYAGARGETEQQMAQTLHFDLPQAQLHPAFNALDLQFAAMGQESAEDNRFQLNVANALWGQNDYTFLPEFLDTLAQNYGAGLGLLDFKSDPEAARQTINNWVSDRTEERIQDLIPPNILSADTRLVLTNAIYFNADWLSQFDANITHNDTFHLLDGSEVSVPTMIQRTEYGYSEGADYQAVELPYQGGEVSFVAILPAEGQFDTFEASLSAERVEEIVNGLTPQDVLIYLPKFTFDSDFSLASTLQTLGMTAAFTNADFSGMTGNRDLVIGDVLHKAFVAVDEEGTEAAAATAVEMAAGSAQVESIELSLDRPFIFLIRETTTGTVLFAGRLLDPR